jgi:hypothetical protein
VAGVPSNLEPRGHIGVTFLPSVRDNTGHERSTPVPAQQLTSVGITGPWTTPALSRTEEAKVSNRCRSRRRPPLVIDMLPDANAEPVPSPGASQGPDR